MIWRRFSDIVKARPEELTKREWRIPFRDNARLRRLGAPARRAVAKGRALLIVISQNGRLKREMIDSPALYDRSGFAAVNDPIRMLVVMLLVIFFRVIIACNLHDIRTFPRILPRHIVGAKRNPRISPRIMLFHFLH
jgi:hypothetical protein